MICEELEKLETENIALRSKARNHDLTDEEKADLDRQEIMMIEKIKDHQRFGHDGQPCPAD